VREPSFTETLQIGIVVRDLETAMRRYVDDYGIGPWDIHEFNAGNAEDLHEHGGPVERSWRLATTMVGRVQWELIEPLDDKSDYARREGRGCPPHRGCSDELRPGVGGPGEERA
jgi:methylmalonyl-CoA/ethylmalonyl-CoA epimerase